MSQDILERIKSLDEDATIQNLIAQANAKNILLNTAENKTNYPPFTIDDERLNILALHYLNLGCTLAERGELAQARHSLDKGASILENIHSPQEERAETSNYYCLISAMAFYVSFQYSKSFILIRKIQPSSDIASLIGLFLQRNFVEILDTVVTINTNAENTDAAIAEYKNLVEAETRIYTVSIAKALNSMVLFHQTGDDRHLQSAKELLSTIKEIAEIQSDPGIWWVIRLLILIVDGFTIASLWKVLGNYFDINDDLILHYIYALIYQNPKGIYELFISQRQSLPIVLDKDKTGSIISIPTSSGKTRIAEIAILNCFTNHSNAKVLYIAPFRSLAFEIESSFGQIFKNNDIAVSHLYGGSVYSSLDEQIIEDSDIIIATPEKAKAILRGNQDLICEIKLIIIDEGHLLGPYKRLIVNEIFYEELRNYSEKHGGKFLLLSAVLPNAEELAEWLTKSAENVYKENWRPSDERLGRLEWDGSSVSLYWKATDSKIAPFNPKFITQTVIPKQGRQIKDRIFPNDRNDAVAATAFKLKSFGSTLIFVGRKDSVFTIARSYEKCLGSNYVHDWDNQNDWSAFILSSIEIYGKDNPWLYFARKGIVGHNADLHADVRLPLERLMRSDKPPVIISTSTLGQGVNLGVSSVIFVDLEQDRNPLTTRDFWNIAGRAGRAFVDNEGKILVYLDTTKSRFAVNRQRNLINEYFDKSRIDPANSGILSLLSIIKKVADDNNVDFNTLTQLIAENKIEDLPEEFFPVDDTLDWIDDTLLALHLENNQEKKNDYKWIESFFKQSLAYIQNKDEENISNDEIIQFLTARIKGITKKIGQDRTKWLSIIKSGIPLNSDLIIEDLIPKVIANTQEYLKSDLSVKQKIELSKNIELLLVDLPVLKEIEKKISSVDLNDIREKWFSGVPISEIRNLENAINVMEKFYGFNYPWLLNGIAKKMKILSLEDEALVLEELSLLSETGLPNIEAVKIYQAGIRSRKSAIEISETFEPSNMTSRDYRRELVGNFEAYSLLFTESTVQWIELLANRETRTNIYIDPIPLFELKDVPKETTELYLRNVGGQPYIVSDDLDYLVKADTIGIDFFSILGIPGIYFNYKRRYKKWGLKIVNPYIRIRR